MLVSVVESIRALCWCSLVGSDDEAALSQIGTLSCVTRFIKKMLGIVSCYT